MQPEVRKFCCPGNATTRGQKKGVITLAYPVEYPRRMTDRGMYAKISAYRDGLSNLLPLCGKNLVNTQYRRVWEKSCVFGIRMFPTVYVRISKKCSGTSKREPPPPGTHLPDFWREKNLNFNYSGELRKQLRTHTKS